MTLSFCHIFDAIHIYLIYIYYVYFVIFLKGILFSTPDSLKSPLDLIRLWNHECNRVYKDKLVDNQDLDQYDKIQLDFNRKFFEVIL